MQPTPPATTARFVELLGQAVFETRDVISAVEYDETGEFEAHVPRYQALLDGLERLLAQVRAGTHRFADGKDLQFMPLARELRRAIPYFSLLETINAGHRAGVD